LKPIIFNSESVRAILDGRKSQTRRVIKPQPKAVLSRIVNSDLWTYTLCDKEWKCPYGKIGSRLWVRETFSDYMGDIYYRASFQENPSSPEIPSWQSSIFMSKDLSRITLEITNIKVERVKDITEKDAKAEGCELQFKDGRYITDADPEHADCWDYKLAFEELWDYINEKRGFGWEKNPFVWVIEFKVAKNRKERTG